MTLGVGDVVVELMMFLMSSMGIVTCGISFSSCLIRKLLTCLLADRIELLLLFAARTVGKIDWSGLNLKFLKG